MIVVVPLSVVSPETVKVSVVVPPVTPKPLSTVAPPDKVDLPDTERVVNDPSPDTFRPPLIPSEQPETEIPLERVKVPLALANTSALLVDDVLVVALVITPFPDD